MTARLQAEFVGQAGRRIFVVTWQPARSPRECVLLVPPFGEEMNKTRAMYAELGRRLAAAGLAVVAMDLYGTGDSDGEFSESDWDGWCEDLRCAYDWARAQGWYVGGLVATRMGCALAARALSETDRAMDRTVFWQPVGDGSRYLQQMLRTRVAASMMGEIEQETTSGLRARLREGETLEVAGYEITPKLADQLDGVRLADVLGPHLGTIFWLEVLRDPAADMPASARRVAAAARERGIAIDQQPIVGEPFWSSVEIVRNAHLLDRTVGLLTGVA